MPDRRGFKARLSPQHQFVVDGKRGLDGGRCAEPEPVRVDDGHHPGPPSSVADGADVLRDPVEVNDRGWITSAHVGSAAGRRSRCAPG